MNGRRYTKERKLRRKYRRIARRLTYLQRKRYDRSIRENRVELNQGREEEDRLSKGLSDRSRFFTIRIGRSGRRGSRRRYRTRSPGRFRHELQKRKRRIPIGNRRRRTGLWKWYESDVDVTRMDRGRSRGIGLRLSGRRYRTYKKRETPFDLSKSKESKEGTLRTLREIRKRGRWRSRVGSRRRIEERRERSNRRSRGRLRRGYRRYLERSRRRIYRIKGRKRK